MARKTSKRDDDKKLWLKISTYNAIGLLVAVGSPLVIDPRLTTHVLHPNRQYPNTKYWVIALIILCPIVFAFSYFLLKRKVTSRYITWLSCLPVLIPGCFAAFLLACTVRPAASRM
ncbi:MAG: hypothetical protein QOF62_1816 [Pyrinomonadaceae bacterium]|nr:hypothetical protein [Pyrinomonadaceae bacterium]